VLEHASVIAFVLQPQLEELIEAACAALVGSRARLPPPSAWQRRGNRETLPVRLADLMGSHPMSPTNSGGLAIYLQLCGASSRRRARR